MEWRKIKTIIILILLLVNGFLLVIVGARWGEVRRYEQSALTQSVQVLENNGITVDSRSLSGAERLVGSTVERSIPAEQGLVAALLGAEVSVRNQGGGLYSYASGDSWATFRVGGQIEARLAEEDRWVTSDPEDFALRLAEEMGLTVRVTDSELENGTGTVVLCQEREGMPVYSCRLRFLFDGGRLTQLSGTLAVGEESPVGEQEVLSLPTALLRFLDEVLAGGDICSAVTAMEPGYQAVRVLGGGLRMEPVWLISTDTADYYMDAVTGELSRLTGE